ncbi:26S proteasome non-ATPase regulatory subunit 13 [Camelus dromedarius]|uniref:26S proteasome non-ATPase regulatory subunit 13 n=1 Tax=Camelus dromedarius TaxID=9838 RepID=A0A5N4BY00_CAMDR|nr:26S proteasome non-ATPase regulatory subunit 13 [Camelus dromedarius]
MGVHIHSQLRTEAAPHSLCTHCCCFPSRGEALSDAWYCSHVPAGVGAETHGVGAETHCVERCNCRFYDLSSKYYQTTGNHASYYKDALRFLGCVDIKDLPGSMPLRSVSPRSSSHDTAAVRNHSHVFIPLRRRPVWLEGGESGVSFSFCVVLSSVFSAGENEAHSSEPLCCSLSGSFALRPVPGPLVLNTEVLDLGECTAQTFQGFEVSEQQERAFTLGLAGLLGEGVFNFGELVILGRAGWPLPRAGSRAAVACPLIFPHPGPGHKGRLDSSAQGYRLTELHLCWVEGIPKASRKDALCLTSVVMSDGGKTMGLGGGSALVERGEWSVQDEGQGSAWGRSGLGEGQCGGEGSAWMGGHCGDGQQERVLGEEREGACVDSVTVGAAEQLSQGRHSPQFSSTGYAGGVLPSSRQPLDTGLMVRAVHPDVLGVSCALPALPCAKSLPETPAPAVLPLVLVLQTCMALRSAAAAVAVVLTRPFSTTSLLPLPPLAFFSLCLGLSLDGLLRERFPDLPPWHTAASSTHSGNESRLLHKPATWDVAAVKLPPQGQDSCVSSVSASFPICQSGGGVLHEPLSAQVELLVMKALSVGLVKGSIDEVDKRVHMTWVQPRCLNVPVVLVCTQIKGMKDRLEAWRCWWSTRPTTSSPSLLAMTCLWRRVSWPMNLAVEKICVRLGVGVGIQSLLCGCHCSLQWEGVTGSVWVPLGGRRSSPSVESAHSRAGRAWWKFGLGSLLLYPEGRAAVPTGDKGRASTEGSGHGRQGHEETQCLFPLTESATQPTASVPECPVLTGASPQTAQCWALGQRFSIWNSTQPAGSRKLRNIAESPTACSWAQADRLCPWVLLEQQWRIRQTALPLSSCWTVGPARFTPLTQTSPESGGDSLLCGDRGEQPWGPVSESGLSSQPHPPAQSLPGCLCRDLELLSPGRVYTLPSGVVLSYLSQVWGPFLGLGGGGGTPYAECVQVCEAIPPGPPRSQWLHSEPGCISPSLFPPETAQTSRPSPSSK